MHAGTAWPDLFGIITPVSIGASISSPNPLAPCLRLSLRIRTTKPVKPMKKLLPVLLFAVVGYWFWMDYREQRASGDWPSVQGKVASASVVTHHSTDDDHTRPAAEQLSYEPSLSYEYEVEHVSYVGKRIRVSAPNYESSQLARDTIQMYQRTTTVTVYYDPHDPGRSVLERGCRSGWWRC